LSALELRIADVQEDGQRLLTTCALTVFADNVAVWPVLGDDDAALEVQVDDLLSHLTEYWKPLVLRQTYPLGLNPARPSDLIHKARLRWSELPEEQAELEDEILEAFADCHDLSRCFAGYFDLPPLWMIRSGGQMLVETPSVLAVTDFDAAVAGLVAAGDAIATRLSEGGQRWADLISAWESREVGEELSLLSWSTSLTADVAERLAAEGLLRAPVDLSDAANDNDELRLAARMASALPVDQVREILTLVSAFPKTQAPALEELSASARAFFDETLATARPFEQGERLADFVRDQLDLDAAAAFDIFGLVEKLGVDLRSQAVEPATLDALAVSGPRHGPAILLNTKAVRTNAQTPFEHSGRARVTLAHELCHLLLDGDNALSAVDVLDGLMPLEIEQRARAFGAQLLLPSRIAAQEWFALGADESRDGLSVMLHHLAERFTVTLSVAAWKLEHGARAHGLNLEAMLRSLVPHR
jgi:IrrE N-terminal-like domain